VLTSEFERFGQGSKEIQQPQTAKGRAEEQDGRVACTGAFCIKAFALKINGSTRT
jgi:hypothetical protein